VLVAAAVCPHPPLLVPEASGTAGVGHPELSRLRAACQQAVAELLAASPDLIVAVGAAGRTAEFPPQAAASLRAFGVPYPAAGPGPQAPELPLALTIAAWLLSSASLSTGSLSTASLSTASWGIAADAPPAECLELGTKLAALAPRVALLALGDGPGRRARNAPGAADPGADAYSGHVAAALGAADHAALAALDPSLDVELYSSGRPAWQVLAGAAAGAAFTAELSYVAAPFEVTYFVASWHLVAAP
jgi:hypothetical protein